MARTDRHIYTREEAPHFVNKFSSGEPNYRDSTFFPHWVQLNWLNGFDQEFFDDGGKFYRSMGLDTTLQQKLTLQKGFSSAGQLASGVNVSAQAAWRASAASAFGDGSDGALTISANTTQAPIDSACAGAKGSITLTATNASFAPGQQILIHQTRGASVGKHQKTKILAYSTGVITTEDPLDIAYSSTGSSKAQVIVMPQYTNVTVDSGKTWTAKAWNGTVGGILCFITNGTVTITGTISANGGAGASGVASHNTGGGAGGGFRGGNVSYQAGIDGPAYTGEGTVGATSAKRSANGNGGGGGGKSTGDSPGSGGGGGNGTAGSNGNNQNYGGLGGGVAGTADLTTLVFGGGGGGGGKRSTYAQGGGGAGGGIIFFYGATITITGLVRSNGGAGGNGAAGPGTAGGGGAGGSVLLKAQIATLGTNKITAAAGAGGSGGEIGGAGGAGRIAIKYLTSYTGTTTPTIDATQDGTLSSTPAGSDYTHISGNAEGKIYSYDEVTGFTEIFDTRKVEWYEAGTDANKVVGDTGGTETAQSQGFKVDAVMQMKAVEVYIKKAAGTPGDITVRIETDSSAKPSGTLVDTDAEATIPAFVTATYGWIKVEFPAAFDLAATTLYHIVLKTAAAANDQNYTWAADDSSPAYSDGAMSVSTDGGSSWTAVSGSDAYFRVLGNETSVNIMRVSSLSGSRLLYIGVGAVTSTEAGDARIYSYDGTDFVLVHTFVATNESYVGVMLEYGAITNKMYIGLGSTAKIYTTEDFSTFTLAKTITVPDNPGYVFDMIEYNRRLYICGGYPQLLYGNNYQYGGFLVSWDEYTWENVGHFTHTVLLSLEVFDNLLFLGTIKKRLYVYNTASIDKLFEFPWDVQITDMIKWDDKLAMSIAPTPGSSSEGEEGIYLFDRNGFHNAFASEDEYWYSLFVFSNNLMAGNNDGDIFQTSANTFQLTGYVQGSYDEAQLPSIEKIRRSLILIFESLPSGCSIAVSYKEDESDASWTSLGTADTDDSTTESFNFANGVYSKKISFKVTLTTTDPSVAPVLKKVIHKYVLSPDFKYLWKMKLLCADRIIWLDGTEPVAILGSAASAGDTSITLKSTDVATPTDGFPDPDGETMYASLIDPDSGEKDTFTYTGKTDTTLTGIPATGDYAIEDHAVGHEVRITGADLHRVILALKETRQLYEFTDIDGLTFTVLFHSYESDFWVINQEPYYGGLENEVPITLLEA